MFPRPQRLTVTRCHPTWYWYRVTSATSLRQLIAKSIPTSASRTQLTASLGWMVLRTSRWFQPPRLHRTSMLLQLRLPGHSATARLRLPTSQTVHTSLLTLVLTLTHRGSAGWLQDHWQHQWKCSIDHGKHHRVSSYRFGDRSCGKAETVRSVWRPCGRG